MQSNVVAKSRWYGTKLSWHALSALLLGLLSGFNPGVSRGNVYESTGELGDLKTVTETVVINTGATPPTLKVGANPVLKGRVDAGAAVYDFRAIDIGINTVIQISGNRPLVMAASQDLICSGTFDVSGGLAGGGMGGAPATGTLTLGKPGVAESFYMGNGGLGGYAGPPGSGGICSSSPGGKGAVGYLTYSNILTGTGQSGYHGDAGLTGGLGFNSPPPAANGGAGGDGGAGGALGSNGAVGQGGNGGICGVSGSVQGGDGGAGGDGVSGGKGANGAAGQAASIYIGANSLALGGGNGGGGGGAGGSGGGSGAGAGGSGGGGGGGSSGSVGYSEEYCCGSVAGVCYERCTRHIVGYYGQYGGEGGQGGFGANGIAGGYGGAAGAGGNGGGCIVLSARGMVQLAAGAELNISASAPEQGKPGQIINAENVGGNGYWGYYGASPGGRGGKGGNAVSTASGGTGGRGGYATPGMLKLHGSVIKSAGIVLKCDNHQSSTATGRLGRLSLISNMTDKALANLSSSLYNSDDISTGSISNPSLLTTTSLYDPMQKVPFMPTLIGGPAAGGFCLPEYYNGEIVQLIVWGYPQEGGVVIPYTVNGTSVKLVRLSGTFEGFDQVFIHNSDSKPMTGGKVIVAGNEVVIPTLQYRQSWVMAVKTGVAVTMNEDSSVSEWAPY